MSNCLTPAAVRMTMRYPFWCEIFYSMSVLEVVGDPQVETAATDGRTFWVNPQWWRGLSLDEAVGVMAHEICHKIFLHCTRQGSRDGKLWNYACDYAINALLKSNGFTLPLPHLYDAKYEGMSAEQVYADLLSQQRERRKNGGGAGAGDAGEAIDGKGDAVPGVSQDCERLLDVRSPAATPEEIEKIETAVKALVERATANAKARGMMPLGVEQGIVTAFKPSREPWYNHLHRFMQSLSAGNYNWARLNRRTLKTHGYFSPLHLHEAIECAAVFIDTSGSCMNDAEQAGFFGHLNAIMAETKPRKIHLYSFDARVYPAGEVDPGEIDATRRLRGGGGTRFEPIFQQLDEDALNPDVVIILTDLMGSFPADPGYPVVWCTTVDTQAPFGDTIYVE